MGRSVGAIIVGCLGLFLATCVITLYATGVLGSPAFSAIVQPAALLWLLIPWFILAICIKKCSRLSTAFCAALAATGVFISIAEDFHGRGGAGAVGDGLLLGRGGIIAYILPCAIIIAFSAKLQNHSIKPAALAGFLTFTSLTAGWWAGLNYWANQTPSRVIEAARDIADVAPYCIATHDGQVHRNGDLVGLKILSPGDKGVHWDFHALLKVQRNAEIFYYNWSHRASTFLPVNQGAREGLRLDQRRICIAKLQFARALSG